MLFVYLFDLISQALRRVGVGRDIPSEFSIIFGVLPSITATAELVVPSDSQDKFMMTGRGMPGGPTKVNANDLAFNLLFSAI